MPEGFYSILEDYSREVLRDQPRDIIEYSYLYFKAMEEGTLDQFDYERKGDNLPPPKVLREEGSQQQSEGRQNDYGEELQEQDSQRVDREGPEMQQQDYNEEDDGEEQQFVDENGNPIPPELVEEYMRQQQAMEEAYGQEGEDPDNYGDEDGMEGGEY